MATTPPLPVLTEYRGPLEIQLRDRVTLQDIADGALRIVVQDQNGVYHEALFISTPTIQVYYNSTNGVVEVGSIAPFDGSRKKLTLVCTTAGLTIVDILAQSSMPEVVMYPSVLDENVESAIMLFREAMPKQAIVDGALEMYVESERYGNQYIYPNVDERDSVGIGVDNNIYFTANNIQVSNKNLTIDKITSWLDPNLKFSQPNRLAWMEGYILNDGIDGDTVEGLPSDVNAITMSLLDDVDNISVLLSQSEGNIVRSYDTWEAGTPNELQFSGGLSQNTIFSSYPKPENVFAIPLRLQLIDNEYIALYPLYAMRKNGYNALDNSERILRLSGSSEYATVGTQSPVRIYVV